MKRNVQCLLLAAFLIAGLVGQAQKSKGTDKRLAGVDTALSRLLKEWKVAGFAVAVVEKDKVIYSQGFGYRDLEQQKPVTPNTLFAIGSCTKAFTASLLGALEKEGKLNLDHKVAEYLPGFRFYNAELTENVTLRDLMCHRTGLPRHDYSWYLFTTKSRDSLVNRIQYLEPSAGLREKWQYNNFMFLLQGVVAEKVTGKSWEQNIKERFFDSLEMNRSNFSVTDLQKEADASLGYGLQHDSIIKKLDYYNIDAIGPAGSINSSVTEMANWVQAWINDGKFKGKTIQSASYLKNAISGNMVIGGGYPGADNPDIHFSNYGLAWSLASYRGHYRVEHGGNIDGFSASTSFFPSDSIGIIVLVNQNASPVTALARNILADRLLKLKYINWSGNRLREVAKAKEEQKAAEKTKTASSRVAGTRPSHALKAYGGNFNNPGYGDIAVYERNDSLFAQVGKDSVWLRHYHYDVFEAKGYDKTEGRDTSDGGTKLNFLSGEDGKISTVAIQLEPSLKQPVRFSLKPKAKALDATSLIKYIGEYEIGKMLTKVYSKGDVLYVFVPGQPEYETIYLGDDTFKLKALDGYSIQFEMIQGESRSMRFIQPNGTFKAVRKK